MAEKDKSFLGRGWAFPVTTDAAGNIQMVSHEEDIRQSIEIILGTGHGERPLRPTFGCDLQAIVFEPMNTATIALVKLRVEQSLIEFEPRIDSIVVKVTPFPNEGKLDIEVSYRVRRTNTFYNLVYPFYLVEGNRT